MRKRRTPAADEADRQRVLDYVRARPGESCQEAEIKRMTGVAKSRVRRLVRGVPGIDPAVLEAGAVRWCPPADACPRSERR